MLKHVAHKVPYGSFLCDKKSFTFNCKNRAAAVLILSYNKCKLETPSCSMYTVAAGHPLSRRREDGGLGRGGGIYHQAI